MSEQGGEVGIEYVYEQAPAEAGEDDLFYEDAGEEVVVAEEVVMEGEVAVEEVIYMEEEVVQEEVVEAVYGEEPLAMEQDGGEFFIDTGGQEEGVAIEGEEVADVSQGYVEEGFVEGVVVEEAVAQEVAVEEAAAEEDFLYEDAGVAEAAAAEEVVVEEVFVEEAVAAEELPPEQDEDDLFVMDMAGEEAPAEEAAAPGLEEGVAEEVVYEQVVYEEVAVEAAPAEEAAVEEFTVEEPAVEEALFVEDASAEPLAEEVPELDPVAEGQLLGNLMAAEFSMSLDDETAAEEPASKRQRINDGLSPPIAKRVGWLAGSGSPAPNDVEDASDPLPPSSPGAAFRAPSAKFRGPSAKGPSAKWSPPSNLPAGPPKALSGGGIGVSKAGAGTPVGLMPPSSKGAPKVSPKAVAGQLPLQRMNSFSGVEANSTGTAPSASLNKDQGYVFVCNNQSMREVASRRLFGSPDRELAQMKQHIMANTSLYLLNFETSKLLGPFAPVGTAESVIVAGAFGNRFNAQLKVKPTERLIEVQLEKKIPGGPKDAAAMRMISSMLQGGAPAPPDVMAMWNRDGSTPSGGAFQAPGNASPMAAGNASPRGLPPGGPGFVRPPSMVAPARAAPVIQAAGMDKEGRRFDLQSVVVNFLNVGSTYGVRVLGRDKSKGQRMFDWEGVRRCLKHVTQVLKLQAVGCCFENYKGPDNGQSGPQVTLPADIRSMCVSVQETPSLTGKNHKSADDEMTIKCAYRRNCRFLDNDNYRDWLREMRDPSIKAWLVGFQEMLQMRYFFDTDIGSFDTLDGNIPVGLMDPSGPGQAPGML